MGQARFQKFFNAHVWNTESRSEGSLEDPNVPLDPWATSDLFGSRRSTSGQTVTTEKALSLSAVWRCVNIISGVISYMPSKPYRDTDNGREVAKDHNTYKLFTRRPSPLYTKSVYWERSVTHLLLRGNHYAEIILDRGGRIVQYDLILPSKVEGLLQNPDTGRLFYKIKDRKDLIPMERMIHVPHHGEDPIKGKGVIEYAREDLGMEMARRETGAKFWLDGGRPEGMIVTKQKLTAPQEAAMKESFKNKKKEGGTILAPFGVEYQTISMNPADQEFIMSGNYSVATICRWFGVPLHKLSELERATNNNVEHQAIEFLQDTLSPICEKIEDEYTTKSYTLDDEQDIYMEFNMGAYQRADSQAQAESFRTGIQNGYMTPNSVANKLNEPKVDGGDRAFIQSNMMPLDSVDKIMMKKASSKPLINSIRQLAELAELEYKTNGNGH